MGLVSKVIERVRAYYPYGSARFGDSDLTAMIHAVDCTIRERTECTWATTDISLVSNAIYYPLPSDVVRVHSVLYSLDGVTFDDGVLKPMTFRDLDTVNPYWHDNGGTPEHYTVFSTPGVDGKSYLVIWPKLTSASNEAVRVEYVKCYPDNDATFAALDDIDDWMIDSCYVPHVLAQIYAQEDPKRAVAVFKEFLAGADAAEAVFANRYGDSLGGPRIYGPGMSEGQIL